MQNSFRFLLKPMSSGDSLDTQKQKAVDKSIDELRLRYGSRIIFRASFLHSRLKPITGGVMEEDYPIMSNIL